MTTSSILQQLREILSKRILVMDGAMGTELLRPGRTLHSRDWIETTLGSPDEVEAIHRSYCEAGAQVHIANTFATSRHVLRAAGVETRFEDLNRGAVALCAKVIAESGRANQWIAGSVSTYVIGSDRAGLPALAELQDNVREHVLLLADAGCGLIALEMLFDVETSIAMMMAAAVADLPVLVGLTCVFDQNGAVRLRGERRGRQGVLLSEGLPEIISAMTPGTDWILGLMHSDLDVTDEAMQIACAHWAGPLAVYPNSGAVLQPDGWDFDAVCSPQHFTAAVQRWTAQGATIVGGCCGLGPQHIAALGAEFSTRQGSRSSRSHLQ